MTTTQLTNKLSSGIWIGLETTKTQYYVEVGSHNKKVWIDCVGMEFQDKSSKKFHPGSLEKDSLSKLQKHQWQ